jgi:hypothetical protein
VSPVAAAVPIVIAGLLADRLVKFEPVPIRFKVTRMPTRRRLL